MNTILNAICLIVFGLPAPTGFLVVMGPHLWREITRRGIDGV
jgi:hypothetical protein